MLYLCFVFFFQAEDGIRDLTVTGVQTCALPILGIDDLQPPAGRVGIEAEAAAEHEEERAGGPSLRRARDRVAHHQVALAATHAAIELGKAVVAELAARIVCAGGGLRGGLLPAVVRKAPRDQRVVVRPDGA